MFLKAGFTLAGLFLMLLTTASYYSDQAEEPLSGQALFERGKYMVTLGVCSDCHTPKVFTEQGPLPDETRALSGHPANLALPEIPLDVIGPGKWILFNDHSTACVGPWGISFAANLTPDEETGLGNWSEENFIQAMRTGKHKGEGRPILPPMPWFNLAKLTDQDLRAIFAYLQTLPPIHNPVPQPLPPAGSTGN
jgi:mono/diheme cytochrome c family protein